MIRMEIFILCLFLFLMGCFLGYLLEVFFRRFFSAKKWVNPGFMKGPWLPLYGFGLLLMFALSTAFHKNFADWNLYDPTLSHGPNAYDLIPILVMGVTMNVLELLAGLIFVKGFKVRLWDYSNMKGNFMGILCPVFSLIWVAISVLYYYGAHPFVYKMATDVFGFMFLEEGKGLNFGVIFLLGVAYGIFLIDLVGSIGLFSKVVRFAKESGLSKRYEEFRVELRKKKEEAAERFALSLPKKEKPETIEKIEKAVKKAIYIDPEKESASGNYGEDGRPIKEDDPDQKRGHLDK